LKLLVTVKAYPNPSRSLVESSCIAGITEEKKFVRLYPVPFRDLEDGQRFEKYQWIQVPVRLPKGDPRPGTFRPQFEKLEVLPGKLGTGSGWRERWEWVRPVISGSLCDIQDAQGRDGTSIGLFKPERVLDFDWETDPSPTWTESERVLLKRKDLFLNRKGEILEKIPFTFRYRFRCSGCRNSDPHHMKIVDWELMQLYRRMRLECESLESCLRKVRDKWLGDLCGPSKDTHFFVGNMVAHPGSFLVLGVFWPPKQRDKQLL